MPKNAEPSAQYCGRTIASKLCLRPPSGRTYYCKISWSFEVARLGVIMIVSLYNLTCTSAALLPKCLSNIRAIGNVSESRGFETSTRSCGETSTRLVNKGPGEIVDGCHAFELADWFKIPNANFIVMTCSTRQPPRNLRANFSHEFSIIRSLEKNVIRLAHYPLLQIYDL